MKRLKSSFILSLITILSFTDILAQSNAMDTTNQGKPMLFGNVTKSDYLQAPFNEWFAPNYDTFEITKTGKWEKLRKNINQYNITIYMGTWCGDSRRELPRMVKTLEELDFDMSRLQIIALNQLKQANNRNEKNLNIHRVPTMVATKKGKEVGRIVESPVNTIEEDLTQIIISKKYQPNYFGLEVLHEIVQKKGIEYLSSNQKSVVKKLKPIVGNAYEIRKYGIIYLRNNQIDEAITFSKLNHALFPDSDIPWYSLGGLYVKKGDLAEAELCYKKAIELNPDNKYVKASLEQLGTY